MGTNIDPRGPNNFCPRDQYHWLLSQLVEGTRIDRIQASLVAGIVTGARSAMTATF
jgi:hypothetical protein